MKKSIAILMLLFAFSISANAQEQKLTADENAKIEAAKISGELGLKGAQQDEFIMLYVTKHRALNEASYSPERKSEAARISDERMKQMLTPEQLAKLSTYPGVLSGSGSAIPATAPSGRKK